MKKILSLFIVGAMAVCMLASCGGSSTAGTNPPLGTDVPPMYTDPTREPVVDPQNTTSATGNPVFPGGDKTSWMDSLNGTERAKLLLADQRLDATVLNTNGNLFENGAQVMYNLIDIAIANLGIEHADAVLTPVSEANITIETIKDEFGTTIELGDKTVRWSSFPESNNSYGAFLGMTKGIVQEAEMGAELINFVKKNMRVINKWVNYNGEKYYLQVDANSETLFKTFAEDTSIIKRYKNEAGKDVYEMYRVSDRYEKRTLYIPGERYEFSDSYQYFTADKSKGYWEVYSMNEAPSHYNVSYFIIKDNICYDAFYNPVTGEITTLKVMSSDRKADIFNITTYFDAEHPENNHSLIDIKFAGFDGIDYVETSRANVEIIDWSGQGDLAYIPFKDIIIHMQNGKVINLNNTYLEGKAKVYHLNVDYTVFEGYSAQVCVRIDAPVLEDQIELLHSFLNENGFVCRRDINGVFEGIDLAYEELEGIVKYYKWNGINVSTEEGIAKAILQEKDRAKALNAEYEAVKDEEVIEFTDYEDMEIHISFAPITKIFASGVSLDGLKVTVPEISLTVNDTILYVKEDNYKVMFALKKANGGLVHFDIQNVTEVKYSGESEFTVDAENVSFELPEVVPGDYTVVCYIATADGIRSSAYTELKFTDAKNVPLVLTSSELSAAIDENGVIKITYTEKLDHYVSMHSMEALDFEKFKAFVGEEAFKYGIPKDDVIEKLVGEEYAALTGEESEIESGTYRIFYSATNGNTSRTGYVYISYECRIPEIPSDFNETIERSTAYDYSAFKAEVDILAEKHGIEYTVIEKLVGEEYISLTGEETAIEAGEYRITQVIGEGEEATTKCVNIIYAISASE